MIRAPSIPIVAAAFLAVLATAGAQPTRPKEASLLQRADSAWASGNRAGARALYAEVLASDSTQSRAIFRLAQLDESSERSLALYRRYIALEPRDAWGHMAEGDLLARMGRWDEGLIAYAGASAMAPGERDVALGRARLLDRAGRPSEAAAELAAWTTRHPDDGEAWDLLGRSLMRSGRPRAAAGSFEKALSRGVPGAAARLNAARASSAPSINPEAASAGDSDGNRSSGFGGSIDVMPVDGVRLGAGFRRILISNDVDHADGTDILGRLTARMAPGVSVSFEGGVMRFGAVPRVGTPPPIPVARAGTDWNAFQASARLRARAASNGPSVDLRAERTPLVFSPALVFNRVLRSEARVTLEVPLARMRLRGSGRAGQFEAPGEPANARLGAEGALVYPLGGLQPSIQYRLIGYQRASAAGYFAPLRAETAEAGAYFETGDDGRLSFAADLGAGMQRVTEHGGLSGGWSQVWRAWALAALALGPSRSWFVEMEAYDAPFAPDGVAAADGWRFLSVSSGLRWALR